MSYLVLLKALRAARRARWVLFPAFNRARCGILGSALGMFFGFTFRSIFEMACMLRGYFGGYLESLLALRSHFGSTLGKLFESKTTLGAKGALSVIKVALPEIPSAIRTPFGVTFCICSSGVRTNMCALLKIVCSSFFTPLRTPWWGAWDTRKSDPA